MKVGPNALGRAAMKYVEGQKYVDAVADNFKALRQRYGSGVDIAIDFHGAVQPLTALLLMKALAPYPRFKRPSGYLGCKQRIRAVVNDRIGIEPKS